MMKKRIFALFLILCLCLTAVPVLNAAPSGGTISDSTVTWELDGNTLIISGTGAMPEQQTYPWDDFYESVTTLIVEGEVTRLAPYAFIAMNNLESVTIGGKVKRIPKGCFAYCTSLHDVQLSDKVNRIGIRAFEGCESLKELQLPRVSEILDYAFLGSGLKRIYFHTSGAFIETTAFDGLKMTAYFPKDKEWKQDQIQNYRGNVVWKNSDAITITKRPAERIVAKGENAKFTVSAKGTNLKYQWQYRESTTSYWKNATAAGNKTASLSVPATAKRHKYQYRCKITDGDGNIAYTNAVYLYVTSITKQPYTDSQVLGNKYAFEVEAIGKGLKYQWQYKESSNDSWKNATATGNKTRSLKVQATKARHGNYYRCKITDAAGNVMYSKTVRFYAMGITKQPKSVTVYGAQPVTFTVQAFGKGLKYRWERCLDEGSWSTCDETGWNTASLTVSNEAYNYSGIVYPDSWFTYRCHIEDAYGTVVRTVEVEFTVK